MNDEEIRKVREEYLRAFDAAAAAKYRKDVDAAIVRALTGDRCPCSACEARS